ncbi:hypothetical protein TNCV_848931 [Trichonephila clavipes]|uniref:Mutator-like transposase domain-containing protein n=1 Tax=Trichonephila clavipes TaxID=2585209 RepID=A0A8X6RHW2_TRICX|nr:hypothetical protein TNCV_848931 [Trichonephila clavipes]
MRTLGVGLRGIKTFCSVMDLPPPVSQKSYDRILNNIKSASSIVAVASMNKAAKEELQHPKQMKFVLVVMELGKLGAIHLVLVSVALLEI